MASPMDPILKVSLAKSVDVENVFQKFCLVVVVFWYLHTNEKEVGKQNKWRARDRA